MSTGPSRLILRLCLRAVRAISLIVPGASREEWRQEWAAEIEHRGALLCGLAGALLMARVLRTLLFEVQPYDPLTLGSVCAVLAAVGLTACYLPALRATRVDPVVGVRVQ